MKWILRPKQGVKMKAIRRLLILIAVLTLLAQVVQAWAADRVAPAKKDEVIRKLTADVDPVAGSQWAAKPGVRVATDEKELTKLLGEAAAKQIAGKIDFAKENLVHVAWGSSGPPFGRLQHEIKGGKDGKAITFFVKVPKTLVQGQAYRLGNDFFAVPKDFKVKFGGIR